ncbi:MAG: N-acetyltransferase family protein [Thermoplasmata archaeon]
MFRSKTLVLRDGRKALVRRALPRDAQSIIAHVNAIGAERVYLMTDRLDLSVSEERAYLQECNTDRENELYLVALVAGEIVGTANFSRGRRPKIRHVASLGIALRKDTRGVGLGMAMMREGMGWARAVGIRKLTLGVFATNRAALGLYRKLGFRTEGRLRGQAMIRGRPVDEVLMAFWT